MDASKGAGSSRPLTLSAETSRAPAPVSFFRDKSAAQEQNTRWHTVGGRRPVDGRANNWGDAIMQHLHCLLIQQVSQGKYVYHATVCPFLQSVWMSPVGAKSAQHSGKD